jgi:hypothetical protein
MVSSPWHVHRADADAVLAAAWEIGSVRVGHLVIDAHATAPHWWWTCCCGIAGGFAGPWEHASVALAGFMTVHRYCGRLVVWDREETQPIPYQIETLSKSETPARGPR